MTFKVLETDADGTAYLQELGMARAAAEVGLDVIANPDPLETLLDVAARSFTKGPDAIGTGFWCRPTTSLEKGAAVDGDLEFHPSKSLMMRRLPQFVLTQAA